jgi:hypothetical protein
VKIGAGGCSCHRAAMEVAEKNFEPSQLWGQERRERRRHLLVASLGGVLVAQSGGRRGVPEPTQKLGQRRAGRRRLDRAGMAEVVEAEVVAARRFPGAVVRHVERRRGQVTRPATSRMSSSDLGVPTIVSPLTRTTAPVRGTGGQALPLRGVTQSHGTDRFDAYARDRCPTSRMIWPARFVGNRLALMGGAFHAVDHFGDCCHRCARPCRTGAPLTTCAPLALQGRARRVARSSRRSHSGRMRSARIQARYRMPGETEYLTYPRHPS